jgi:hypothetical protein
MLQDQYKLIESDIDILSLKDAKIFSEKLPEHERFKTIVRCLELRVTPKAHLSRAYNITPAVEHARSEQTPTDIDDITGALGRVHIRKPAAV